MLALRRALLSSLLLVPFAACDDGSSDDESDSGTDGSVLGDGDVDDDGDGDGDGDGNLPGDGDGDTQGDGDAGNGDGDSGTVAFSCPNAFTPVVAGEIISSDD